MSRNESTSAPLRAAAYIRVSTSTQAEEGVSLGEQEQQVVAYAKQRGWTLAPEAIYPEKGRSARTGKTRPEHQRMLADAQAGNFDRLICPSIDRFARSTRDTENALGVLEGAKVEVVFLREMIDTSTPAGRLLRTMLAAFAQLESENTADRVRRSITARATEGRGHGGVAAYGYRFKGNKQDGKYGNGVPVVVPEEAAVVQRIFRDFIGGGSIRSIAKALNEEGIPGPAGGRWGASMISKLLRKRFYLGTIELRGEEYEDGKHTAILDAATWDAARRLRESKTTNAKGSQGRQPSATHLLTRGILKCWCGESMLPRTWKNPAGVRYEHYICSQRIYYGKGACAQPGIEREEVDSAILHYFEEVALDLDGTRAQLREAQDARRGEARLLRESAEREALRLAGQVAMIEQDYLAKKISPERYSDLSERIGAESEAAKAEAARLAQREREVEADTGLDAADADVLARLAEIRAAVAGHVEPGRDHLAVRAALASLFDRFDLRRLWTAEAPEYADLDLSIPGGLVIVPTLRQDVIERYERTSGDREVDVPKPRRIPLNLAENNVSTGTLPNWSQRIGAVAAPHAVETASASRSQSVSG